MIKIKSLNLHSVKRVVIFLLIFTLGVGFGYSLFVKSQKVSTKNEKNLQRAFISEVYDKVKENYWDNISDAQLIDLFRLSTQKNGGEALALNIDNKDKMLNAIDNMTKSMNLDQKNKFIALTVGSVIASLNPAGRSGLYTTKQEEQLKNTVSNINPGKDLYKDLGLQKGASQETVSQAAQQKTEELKKENTPQAQEQLKQVAYAKDVLTKQDNKIRYDQSGIEPTIFTRVITPGILYFHFKKFSPTSFDEFVKAFNSYQDDASLFGLIMDLRGNIGGAIDATPYFLGLFLGKNQYAYDFYHKGEFIPFKTPTDKLASITKYKQIIILVDNQTQSSAEMIAAAFKKYHIGIIVGTPTKGWGTVERVFPLDNQFDSSQKYSLFLVHSITLRDDNQPIEGRGVTPDVNISDSNWEQNLYSYFHNSDLTSAVKSALNNPN